jgi:ornithine--oxo-acid transaminase
MTILDTVTVTPDTGEPTDAAGLSPAGVSPAGVSPAGVSAAGVSPAGVSPAGVSPAGVSATTEAAIAVDDRYAAHNYSPLPVVAASAEGAWVTDVDGRRFLDCLAAYSAVNFGHRNPEITATAHAQLDTVTLVSRAFHSDRLGPFCAALAQLCGKDRVLPMNSGAEAVESGIKVARKWGTDVKGVPAGRANIIVAENNFHGRTISIVSFSSDESARGGFGPFTPGFRSVPFGDAAALAAAIDSDTVAVLLEPIQGEAGIIVPPDDYLPRVRALCSQHRVLMIADEIQSGLGRTGRTFACEHWGVLPDMYLLGKALGGGVVPLSAVVADHDILGVLHPGEHGSTFGGNPLAAAIGTTVVAMLQRGEFQARSAELGSRLHTRLRSLVGDGVVAVRGLGLWAGVDIDPRLAQSPALRGMSPAKQVSYRLAERGVLVKDTHGATLRFAPPLVITEAEIDWAVDQFAAALADVAGLTG